MKLLQEGSSRFFDWGFVHISVGNLVVIALMVVLFAMAVAIPFPRHHEDGVAPPADGRDAAPHAGGRR